MNMKKNGEQRLELVGRFCSAVCISNERVIFFPPNFGSTETLECECVIEQYLRVMEHISHTKEREWIV